MIEIDTSLLREAGNDIITLCGTYSENIDSAFDRISNMPNTTGEWTGQAATKFAVIANLDSQQYKKFATALEAYGKALVTSANEIEILCRNIKLQ
jgi:uncharacterized protein YukE